MYGHVLYDETGFDLFNEKPAPKHVSFNPSKLLFFQRIFHVLVQKSRSINSNMNSNNNNNNQNQNDQEMGLKCGDMIQIVGSTQSGKTELLYQLILQCCLPKTLSILTDSLQTAQSNSNFNLNFNSNSNANTNINANTIEQQVHEIPLGGYNSQCIYIDLNSSFNNDRLLQLCHCYIINQIRLYNSDNNNKRNMNDNNGGYGYDPIDISLFTKSDEYKQFLSNFSKKVYILTNMETCSQFLCSLIKVRNFLEQCKNRKNNIGSSSYDYDYKEKDNNNNGTNNQGNVLLFLIDGFNAFFNELTKDRKRDNIYEKIGKMVHHYTKEYDLITFITRNVSTKREYDYINQILPPIYDNYILNKAHYLPNKTSSAILHRHFHKSSYSRNQSDINSFQATFLPFPYLFEKFRFWIYLINDPMYDFFEYLTNFL